MAHSRVRSWPGGSWAEADGRGRSRGSCLGQEAPPAAAAAAAAAAEVRAAAAAEATPPSEQREKGSLAHRGQGAPRLASGHWVPQSIYMSPPHQRPPPPPPPFQGPDRGIPLGCYAVDSCHAYHLIPPRIGAALLLLPSVLLLLRLRCCWQQCLCSA